MKIQFLPACRVDFVSKDPNVPAEPITLFRPYAALPMDELQSRAERGEPGAVFECAERYYFGLQTEQDLDRAYPYLLQAVELGVQDAEYLVAECYRTGKVVQQDYEKYFAWITRAADHGCWMAMLNLSAAYMQGQKPYDGAGVAIDHEQAFAWSIQAEKAIRGYWEFYDRPNCVDFGETKTRLLQAYLQIAMQLSAHYADGIGVNRDLKKAVYWLERGKRFACNATGQRVVPELEQALDALRKRIEKETQTEA